MNSIKNSKLPAKGEQARGEYSQLLTEKSACEYLGVSSSFLRKGRSEGQHGKRANTPLYIRLGGRIFYRRTDLDRWLAELLAFSNLAEEGGTVDG
ncbi:MAG: helix-turn-helix domain-containing protein [Synergistaceae bacterium]|nr:helix-turn-helix domain-containing protein [Synergistaceae bacterium]